MGLKKPPVPGSLFALIFLAGCMVLTATDWYLYRVHKNGGYPYSLFM